MDMSPEKKGICTIAIIFACYSAIVLGGMLRNRDESIKAENFAKDTNLYSKSTIKSLKGSDLRYGFYWFAFIFAFIIGLVSIFYVDMPTERRSYMLIAGILLLDKAFDLTKIVRDSEDADKWYIDYHGT